MKKHFVYLSLIACFLLLHLTCNADNFEVVPKSVAHQVLDNMYKAKRTVKDVKPLDNEASGYVLIIYE